MRLLLFYNLAVDDEIGGANPNRIGSIGQIAEMQYRLVAVLRCAYLLGIDEAAKHVVDIDAGGTVAEVLQLTVRSPLNGLG